MKILAENTFGHGGKRSFIGRAIRRGLIRDKLGRSGIPFDWATGVSKRPSRIKNQGQSSSCGGQAKSYWLELVLGLTEQSAKSVYSPIVYSGGGTTVPALERDLGSVDEALVSSYQNGETPSEAFMEDTSWKSIDTLKNAMSKLGWTPVSVKIDIESIAEAIRDYGAIIWEIQGQNNGTWLSNNPKPPVGNKNLWQHFMCSYGAGIWNGIKSINMLQSWGEDVGDNGIQHFTEDYIDSGRILDCFTFIRIPKYQFTTNFSWGSWRFQDVYNLQKILIAGGFGNFTPTGFFGSLTFEAVKKYQTTHGIPVTGNVFELTRASLNK